MNMDVLELHVGATATRLRRARGIASVSVDGHPEQAVRACLDAAGVRPQAWLRRRVRLHLSTTLARPFVAGPVEGLASWQEARAFAASAAQAATGFDEPCTVTLEAWPAAAVLATATLRDRLEQLLRAVAGAGARLVSVRPAWALPFNQALAAARGRPALTVLEDDDGVVLLAAPSGRIDVAMSMHPRPTPSELEMCAARVALGQGWQGTKVAHWVWHGDTFDDAGRGWRSARGNG